MIDIRPMLAVDAPDNIQFPVWASPKLDGIRCLIVDNVAVSRTLKPIRNQFIQEHLQFHRLDGLDGELIVGSPTHPNAMQASMSGVMSAEGEPDFTYYVFDYWMDPNVPYNERYGSLKAWFSRIDLPRIKLLVQQLLYSAQELDEFEASCLAQGYEGVITRSFDSPYKYNRSTAKEQYMLKVKRFQDGEAEIVKCNELMHNNNDATLDERGYTKRSSHQDNKTAAGVLGSFTVRDLKTGIEFNIGTGFDFAQREDFWENQNKQLGKIVKYKSFTIGVKDAPRHPVFLGFRDPLDM